MASDPRDGVRAANLLLQLNDAVDQGFGSWWAAGHVDVNRYDAVATTHDRIAVMVITTAIGTRAHGDHPARLRHLVVDLAQGRPHLVAQCAGHDHQIGLTRAGPKQHAEAIQVITRCARVHHLYGAAGQTKSHGPQRAGFGPVDHRVVTRGHEAFVKYTFK